MPGILIFDQATVTGWAHALPGEPPVWGLHRNGSASAWEGEVFHSFRRFVIDAAQKFQPDWLGFEAPWTPRPDRSAAAKPLNPETLRKGYGFAAHLTEIADEFGLQCEEYQSAEVAKFMTGRGRFPGKDSAERSKAKKDAMVAACWARGWRVTHNEADALGMLLFAESRLYPAAALGRSRVFRAIKGPLFQNVVA